MRPGTRSGLWEHMAYAIDQLRPRYVIAENVRRLLSGTAHSDMEPCPWCLGDRPDGHLRALGAVLGDLADLGYDAGWCGLRAADVGAPHGRPRIFIVATDARRLSGEPRRIAGSCETASRRPLSEPAGRDRAPVTLLPTPRATERRRPKPARLVAPPGSAAEPRRTPSLGHSASTPTPLPDGSRSSAGQHPTRPSTDACRPDSSSG